MYDYIIIGAGPGGMDTAAEAHKAGKKVLLIEKNQIGGTCLNRGCIPTKALLASAKTALELSNLPSGFNIDGKVCINYESIAENKDRIVSTLRDGATFTLSKTETVTGEAEIKTPNSVIVNGQEYQGNIIIIATGSNPAKLDIPGAENAMTSDDFLISNDIWKEKFESFAIIGGGVIGIEFATIINSLFPNRELTVIEYCKEILPPFDKEIAKRLRMALTKKGVKFITSAAVKAIENKEISFERNGKQDKVIADKIMMATGRKPMFPKGLENAGIDYSHKGIKVDCDFKTTCPNIYAIGDVNGICMLAHAATAQGKKVLGIPVETSLIPSAVFSIPECAMIGLTEDECKNRGLSYHIRKAFFRANGKAVCMDETEGLIKIILSNDDETILGAHIYGPHASDLLAELVLAMGNGLNATDIEKIVHAHPTLNEIIITALNE